MTTPDAGWYEDPEDPNSQRYWDGQEWTPQRQPKTTSASAGQSTPQTAQLPAPPAPQNPLQPQLEKGRRFWSRLSGQQKVIVGIAAVFVVIVAILVPVFAFGDGAHQSASVPGPAGSPTGSQYYQWGYESATSGAALRSYIDQVCTGFYGCSKPDSDTAKEACGGSFLEDENVPMEMRIDDPDSGTYQAKKNEYVRGCVDAFRDHPPSPTVATRPRH